MPAQAKHSASFQGSPYRFTIQPNKSGFTNAPATFKVVCHGHMYMGRLRQMIAARLNTEPEYLRIIANGEKLPHSDMPVHFWGAVHASTLLGRCVGR